MARIEDKKADVNSLIGDNAGYTKDIQKKLKSFFTSPCTVRFLVVLILILLSVITVLAVQVCPVRNTDERITDYERLTDDERITIINEARNQNPVPCEDDWIWYRGKCYYFTNKTDTWDNSQEFCMSHNASLALIDNQKELDFLVWGKCLDNYWIGLRRTEDNKAWIWTNGTLYNESLFKIEGSSQENECVFLNHDAVRSKTGTVKYRWICNK
ncbi:C-type lectin domain family 2 member A-like isoform X2 [Bufo gargarizans]|uniref:C-type lectin domain family 2 member A-like isoform X2 n=1 Tax=Bufo gargarizans TaxID=30331 RepID=UPI001CF0D9D3|nr:C-type lectin domain family 2 member A-like isoform X2 [Bufo gargarizans]